METDQMTMPENEARRLRREALDWVMHLSSDGLSAEDRARLDAWLAADPRHQEAYDFADMVWQDLPGTPGLAELEPLEEAPALGMVAGAWSRLASAAHIEMSRPALYLPALAAAALLLLFVIPGISPGGWLSSSPDYATEIAEIRDVVLDDGSIVTLGARSRIEVDFTAAERRVALVEGEAFFAVEKDPGRPFIVDVADTSIRVVGTKFDVHRGPAEVRVTVLEGIVEVRKSAAPAGAGSDAETLGEPAPVRIVTSGQQVTSTYAGVLAAVREVAPVQPGAWRQGRLFYDGASLAEIVADANRYYGDRIELATDELGTLRLTAAFGTDEVDRLVDALQRALPLVAERLPDGRIILWPRTGG